MITFITGLPGASKTLNTIAMVVQEWGDSDRQIYYRGINELTLPWIRLTDEQISKWWELPDNSIIVIDEAQQIFPGRANNREVPEGVRRMDTHRHRGFDFYVITQKHTKVDHDLRYFAGRHIHYERQFGWNGARRWEWNQAVDPDDYHARQTGISKRVNFPKKYFSVYKSAEVHTFKKRIPGKIWALGGLLTLVAGLAYAVVDGVAGKADELQQLQEHPVEQGPIRIGPRPYLEHSLQEELSFTEKMTPRVADVPWSAPMYDEVTEVKTFPKPQCIYHHPSGGCKCFTQQATPLDISWASCKNMVDNGWFNPFIDEEGEGGRGAGEARPAPPGGEFKLGQVQESPRVIVLGDSSHNNVPRNTGIDQSMRKM